MKKILFIINVFLVNAFAESNNLSIAEKVFLYHWNSLTTENLLLNSTRLDFIGELTEDINTNIAYEIGASIGSGKNPSHFNPQNSNYRIYDLSPNDIGNIHINHNIDRMLFLFKFSFGDLTIGRQAISFGAARCVNPTDVISALNQETLDKEYRNGVDAIKFTFNIGELSQLEIGAIFSSHFSNNSEYIKTKINFSETDLTFLTIKYQSNFLLGINIEKSILDSMWWFEIAHGWLSQNSINDIPTMLRLSTGIDRTFGENFYGFIEYHYNGAGFNTPSEYSLARSQNAYISSKVFLFGKHYLIPGLSWQVTSLISISSTFFANLIDKSLFFSPKISYNFSENSFLDFTLLLGFGKNPLVNSQGETIYNSEFGAYGKLFLISLRCYI